MHACTVLSQCPQSDFPRRSIDSLRVGQGVGNLGVKEALEERKMVGVARTCSSIAGGSRVASASAVPETWLAWLRLRSFLLNWQSTRACSNWSRRNQTSCKPMGVRRAQRGRRAQPSALSALLPSQPFRRRGAQMVLPKAKLRAQIFFVANAMGSTTFLNILP